MALRSALAGVLTLATALAATGVPTPGAASASTPPDSVRHDGRLLSAPLHGRAAVDALGDDLDVAARRNGKTATQLRRLLLTDPTAWVSASGRVYFKDPIPASPGAAEPAEAGPFPYSQTFELHSNPTSTHKIFLDFDGADVSGTAWNDPDFSESPLPDGTYGGFDLAGNGWAENQFTQGEQDAVQSIWQRVAEDYAPFDVDVTTQDPGAAAIDRASEGDDAYGTRALITSSSTASQALCDDSCGGVAFIGVFNDTFDHSSYQPAWVFPHLLSNDSKVIAEATSHEVGHNMGLSHDGLGDQGYYEGHSNWAPLMGVGYSQPLSQWSRGEYDGATETEDDVATITTSTNGPRADETGSTVGSAAVLPASTTSSYITQRTDVDVFSLGTCTGTVTLSATPAPTSPNLDIRLRLLNSTGTQVAAADPASGRTNEDVASGLNASLSQAVATGSYFVEVDGVGRGNATTGYTDYGSLGAYTITAGGCAGATVSPPTSPTGLSTQVAGPDALTLRWSAPTSNGGSPVTGYTVSRADVAPVQLSAGETSYTFTGLTRGQSYDLSVSARNAVGHSLPASATGTPAGKPGAVTRVSVTRDDTIGSLDVSWSEPDDDGDSPITGYDTMIDAGAGTTTTDTFQQFLVPDGNHTVRITAVNAIGAGPTVTLTPPSQVTGLTATPSPGGTAVTLAWKAPTGGDPAVPPTYDVYLEGDYYSTTSTTSAIVRDLLRGRTYELSVVAHNALGSATPVARTVTLAVPVTVSSAPRIGKAASGAKGGTVSAVARWSPPTSSGGAAITGYQVYAYKLDSRGKVLKTYKTAALSARARSVAVRLTKGNYRFVVRARNSAGWSRLSARSNLVAAR